MLSARLLKRLKRGKGDDEHPATKALKPLPKPKHHDSKDSFFFRWLDRVYTRLLKLSLRHRLVVTSIAILVMISIVPLFMYVGKDFFPQDDQDEFEVSLRAAEGMSLKINAGHLRAGRQRDSASFRMLPTR